MKKIVAKGRLLAIVQRANEWEEGLNFLTEDIEPIQVGTWFYEAGRKLKAHYHKVNPREGRITQEVTFVKKGVLGVKIYTESHKLHDVLTLREGDFAIFLAGGHGYEILEEGTQVLEVKNGPFTSVQQDKELINEPDSSV